MTATLHVGHARIWTGDPTRPWAEAVTIADGRIVELHASTPSRPEAGRVLDAGGRTVVPGLIDAHLHLLMGGLARGQLDLSAVRGRDEFEQAIAARHATLPAGRWLVANGWSNERWPGRAMPDKTWLRAAGDRPVVCHRSDMHASVVNDAVLAQCGASAPASGLMIEADAWELVNPLIPAPTVDERRAALVEAQRHGHALGLTAVGSMEYQRDIEAVYEPARSELTMRCRLTVLDRAWPMSFDFGRSFTNDGMLAVIGYKAFVDGTLGSRTARMLADYDDEPGNRGQLVELAADGHLNDWAAAVAAAGLSPSMHAIGDEAARLALDAAERVPAPRRPRVEHAQQIDPADLPRFAGVIASMQPLHKADDGRYAERRLGRTRLAGTFAFRALHDHGARLAFGSDWPVVTCDPFAGMRSAITGLTFDGDAFLPEHGLTVEETLRAYTAGAAYALGLDDAGVLRPGAAGDLVVLDRDPFAIDWAREPAPAAVTTVVGGRVTYDRGDE